MIAYLVIQLLNLTIPNDLLYFMAGFVYFIYLMNALDNK